MDTLHAAAAVSLTLCCRAYAQIASQTSPANVDYPMNVLGLSAQNAVVTVSNSY